LLTYVKMNFLLNVESLAESSCTPAVVRRLRAMLKRQTSESDRCTKLAKNTDIVRSITSLILSEQSAGHSMDGLFR